MHYNYLHSYTAAWWTQHGIAEMHCTYIYTAAHKRNCLCSYLHSSMVNEMPLYLQYIHRKCLHSYFHGGLIQQRKMPLYLFTPRHGRGNAFILTIYTQEMPTFLFTRRPYTVEENAFVLIYTTAWQRKCLCTYLHNSMVEEMPLFIFTQRHCRKTRKCLRTYLHHDLIAEMPEGPCWCAQCGYLSISGPQTRPIPSIQAQGVRLPYVFF